MTESVQEPDADSQEAPTPAEIQRTITQVEQRAATIRDRELAGALSKLDGLEESERAVIERLATRLTERLIGPPKRSLESAADRDDAAAIAVARELFGD